MNVYEHHDKHFDLVSAFVIVKDGALVGKIAFKFPKDGAGRLYCYLHVTGLQMVRGVASGYGYDKRSAAAWSASKLIDATLPVGQAFNPNPYTHATTIKAAIKDAGYDWQHDLRDAGFEVWQAV